MTDALRGHSAPAEGTERPQNEVKSRFDGVADTYDAIRPGYPVEVFDAISDYSGATGMLRVLEIGIGTGQATAQMASRGWRVVGLEPGEHLAAVARRRLSGYPDIEVENVTFEAAEIEAGTYDVVA
jgi:2-polyprenyl-3-methyl-5-hydroxy-6-metoxy-1,4-benzoquinol methylase